MPEALLLLRAGLLLRLLYALKNLFLRFSLAEPLRACFREEVALRRKALLHLVQCFFQFKKRDVGVLCQLLAPHTNELFHLVPVDVAVVLTQGLLFRHDLVHQLPALGGTLVHPAHFADVHLQQL